MFRNEASRDLLIDEQFPRDGFSLLEVAAFRMLGECEGVAGSNLAGTR